MQQAVERFSRIQKERLNPYQYTLSLLQEGMRVGLVNQQGVRAIQAQIMVILQDLIVRYTNGESTSVKTETAESLLNSIMYVLDAYARDCANAEECLAELLRGGVSDAYEQGLRLVTDCVADARAIYQEVKRTKLDVPLDVYHCSIDEALPGFFLAYNVVFGAHDTMCMLDYPLMFDDMRVRGVYYIWRYLDTLRTETQFCRMFAVADVRRLLVLCGQVYQNDFAASPVNVYEIVLGNALFAVLAGLPAGQLLVGREDFALLRERLGALSPAELEVLVDAGIQRLIDGLGVDAANVVEYLWRSKAVLVQRICTAVEHDSLRNVVLVNGDEGVRGDGVTFVSGERMSDGAFRDVVKRVRACASVAERVSIVLGEIRTLGDFVDLLEADCFYGAEFLELYAGLGDLELGLLGRAVFEEELREDAVDMWAWLGLVEVEREWQVWYVEFLRGLGEVRVADLGREMLRLGEI